MTNVGVFWIFNSLTNFKHERKEYKIIVQVRNNLVTTND